jgi:hypothetical protein
MTELPNPNLKKNPELDSLTLYTAATVVVRVGFQHFSLSQDTRLSLEARQGHRFVSVNCEEMAKMILRLTGAKETDVLEMLHQVGAQVREYNNQMIKKAGEQPVSEGRKQ